MPQQLSLLNDLTATGPANRNRADHVWKLDDYTKMTGVSAIAQARQILKCASEKYHQTLSDNHDRLSSGSAA